MSDNVPATDHRSFRFGTSDFALGFPFGTVTLSMRRGSAAFNVGGMSPAEARAAANALYEAADFAESQPVVTPGAEAA